MPSIRYINQSAPFWDWVASMEDRVGDHPFFASPPPPGPHGPPPAGAEGAEGPEGAGPHPFSFGPFGFFGPSGPFGPHGHQGPHGPYGPHGPHGHGRFRHHGRPDFPHRTRGEAAPRQSEGEEVNEKTADEDRDMTDQAIPDPPEDAPENPPEDTPGRGRRCGGRRGWHGRGGHHHGGPPSWGHPYAFHHGGPRGFGFLSEMFGQPQNNESGPAAEDFKPAADVFDTESAFVVHISLPGANKDDIGVSWDPEKSELTVSGVVHRPGDEAFLKTLALDERKVGAFERKIRLGTRTSPAQVDVDGISAKLDNGILIVEVPKLNADFVEIKKVDIE